MGFLATDRVSDNLFCVVPYFNPWRWRTREKHTVRALKHFHDSGAVIVFVELAFGQRAFAFQGLELDGTKANSDRALGVDHPFRHRHIQLRTQEELWLKENIINIGVQACPPSAQYLAWLDADVHFLRPNWVGETIQKLQHYAFLQMFSHARDLGPNYELLPEEYPHADGIGWCHAYQQGMLPENGTYGEKRVWPGLAWACTRKAWNDVGGLLDVAVWGGGDWHMAHALIERRKNLMHTELHRNYQDIINGWYDRCCRCIRKNVGVLEGTIVHHWHGRKTERGYNAKHRLLAQIGFDPMVHLKRDASGLWQLHDDGSETFVRLRDAFREIAKERNEDSPETAFAEQRQNH